MWYKFNDGAREFKGLKVSQDADAPRAFPEIKRVESRRDRDDLLLTEPGIIGWGGNSGFQALNLAAQCAPAKIILVGYDLRLDRGMHWHGKHPNGQNNPMERNVERWRRAIDGAAVVFEALGIPVINASEVSALLCYPKMKFEDALSC